MRRTTKKQGSPSDAYLLHGLPLGSVYSELHVGALGLVLPQSLYIFPYLCYLATLALLCTLFQT